MKIYLFFSLFILFNNFIIGQSGPISCKAPRNVSLGLSGTALLTPADVLDSPITGSYSLSQSVFNCKDISLSPIQVTVTETSSNNSCVLFINVEDKFSVCDAGGDADGDGCLDIDDANPLIASGDSDGDGIADDCDPVFNIASFADMTAKYINNLNLINLTKTALTNRLNLAHGIYCSGDVNAATIALLNLNAFKIQVNALKTFRRLSTKETAYLIDAANALIGAIKGRNVQCPGQNRNISGINGNHTLDLVVDFGLEVYPNPASDIMNISFGASEDKTKAVIYDLYGKQVWTQEVERHQNILNLDLSTGQFKTGMYIISVSNGNGTQTQKVLVNR